MSNHGTRGGSHEQHVKAGEQSHKDTSDSSQKGPQDQHAKVAQQSHGGGPEHKSGNFAQNREQASEAGRKGGKHSGAGHKG